MTEPSRLEAAQDAQSAEHDAGDEWYRSPIALIAGLVIFVAALALIVLAVTGGDDVADVTTSGAAQAAPVITFGGVDVPELDVVEVRGDALPSLTREGPDEAIGTLAPEVTATSLANGQPISLGTGRARVIGFFAHWCPHCQAELPEVTEWLAENQLPPNTEFIAVSTAVDEGSPNYPPSAWFNDVGWAAPVVVDDANGTLLTTFGFGGFPAFVAIDASGIVIARESGNIGVEGLERLFANFAS